MYAFPPIEDLSFLLDDEPCLDHFQVMRFGLQVGLDTGCAIHWEGRLAYLAPDGSALHYDSPWADAPLIGFHALLGKRPMALEREDLSLTLTFEGGGAIRFYSELGPYENGTIRGPDDKPFIIV